MSPSCESLKHTQKVHHLSDSFIKLYRVTPTCRKSHPPADICVFWKCPHGLSNCQKWCHITERDTKRGTWSSPEWRICSPVAVSDTGCGLPCACYEDDWENMGIHMARRGRPHANSEHRWMSLQSCLELSQSMIIQWVHFLHWKFMYMFTNCTCGYTG